jgi:hypothetical protein
MFIKNIYNKVVFLDDWDQSFLNYLCSDAVNSAQGRTAFCSLNVFCRLEAVSSVWMSHAIRRWRMTLLCYSPHFITHVAQVRNNANFISTVLFHFKANFNMQLVNWINKV